MADTKKRVLLVDDDEMVRGFTNTVLCEEYAVMEAEDGIAGWEKARAWKPDLVITDLMMPRMHGYELCKLLKGPEGIPGVKVMVASSKMFAADKALAGEAGADEYIVKPYNIAVLREKVRSLLYGGAPSARPAGPAPDSPASAQRSSAAASCPAPGKPLPVYVRFWGTRGSCPTAGMKTVRYGGNTPCTEIRIGDVPLILDCGTGLRELGCALSAEFAGRPVEGHIFVGHTHWDHIQGFPFFTPLYNPANTFSVYSVRGAHSSLRSLFSDSMALDYFPVPLSSLGGKVKFIELEGVVDLCVAKVSYLHLNHPGVCIGFRIEAQGKVITYLSDHENFGKLGGENELSRRQDAAVADFARGSDLLIREAQYTEKEYLSKKGWGHSTYDDVAAFAVAAEVKRLAIFHHDPEHTDDIMDANVKYCRDLLEKSGAKVLCFAAWDGLRVDL